MCQRRKITVQKKLYSLIIINHISTSCQRKNRVVLNQLHQNFELFPGQEFSQTKYQVKTKKCVLFSLVRDFIICVSVWIFGWSLSWGWCATSFHLNNCCRMFYSNQKHVSFSFEQRTLDCQTFIVPSSFPLSCNSILISESHGSEKTHLNIFWLYISFQEGLFSFPWILLYASFMNHCKEMKNYSCYIRPFNTWWAHFWGRFRILSLYILIRFHFTFL